MVYPQDDEIIDLTSSSPKPAEPDLPREDGEVPESSLSEAEEGARQSHSRRKKRKRSKEDVVVDISVDLSKEGKRPDGGVRKGGEGSRKERRRGRGAGKSDERPQDADPSLDDVPLFFVDNSPAQVPSKYVLQKQANSSSGPLITKSESSANSTSKEPSALLLPVHVSLTDGDDGTLVEIIRPPESDSESESYIEYLDYDDRAAASTQRYFNTSVEDAKQTKFLCKKCGAENEHRTYECTLLICLTCGVRDEHPTRSCPVSKTCFSCGMKGHISKDCPNRYTSHATGMSSHDDCDRCGSGRHRTNECPTLWRLYDYVNDNERQVILQLRQEKRTLGLGKGGEGYIATNIWCYNCGSDGHMGDDCENMSHSPDIPVESSAFSLYNTMTGPFFDSSTASEQSGSFRRGPRDWEDGETLPDGWGFDAPVNVGKQGRKKDRARMEQQAREVQEMEDDPDDWFGNAQNTRNRGHQPSNQRNQNGQTPKKISFGSSLHSNGRHTNFEDTPRSRQPTEQYTDGAHSDRRDRGDKRQESHRRPSLLDRIQEETEELHIRGAYRRRSDSRRDDRDQKDRDRPHSRSHRGEDKEHRREDRDYRRRDSRGPKYRGGYSR